MARPRHAGDSYCCLATVVAVPFPATNCCRERNGDMSLVWTRLNTDSSVEGLRPLRWDSRRHDHTSDVVQHTAHLLMWRYKGTIQRDIATTARPSVDDPRCSRRHLPNNRRTDIILLNIDVVVFTARC